MNIYQLRYLKSIVENESYSLAAEELYVTQSTLIIAIKKLENELGVTLLCKDSKRTLLTSAGRHIYPVACKAISAIDQIYRSADDYCESFVFDVRIGIPTLANADDLLLALREHFKAPAININVIFDQFAGPDGMAIKLDNGELDLAILIKPIVQSAIKYTDYKTKQYNIILPYDHPLAGLERITPEMISAEPLLLVDWKSNRGITRNILEYLKENCVPPSAYENTSLTHLISTPTLLQLVQKKEGLAILSEKTELPDDLVKKPLAPPLLLETVIAWNTESYESKLRKKVLEFIRDYIK